MQGNMKVFATLVVALLAISTALAMVGEEASAAANYSISGDHSSIEPEGKLEFKISFTESDKYESISITYKAKLLDSKGETVASGVVPSVGSLEDAVSKTIKVNAPKDPGQYTLQVEFTEKINDGKSQTFLAKKTIDVIQPIKLSLDLENKGTVDLNDVTVYFYVDGKKINDSKTTFSVKAGDKTTVSYNYADKSLSHGKHTFYALPDDSNYLEINGLGEAKDFYFKQGNFDFANYILILIFILLVLVALWVFRKPIKNFGKPKARR